MMADRSDPMLVHSQVANGKPAPDVFMEAARQLGVAPQNCICFEDAPSGVQVSESAVSERACIVCHAGTVQAQYNQVQ